jgi:hypothetical protein
MIFMQIPRPTKSRLIVFTVPVRRKLKGSILYTPSPRRNTFTGSQECWIVSVGPEVREKFKMGQRAFVHDGFEFEDIKQDYLWDDLQNEECFKGLKEYVTELDGDVAVKIVTESSILAVEE